MNQQDSASANIAEAARAGEFDRVLELLAGSQPIDTIDEYGGTALIYAVAAHNEVAVRSLLQRGASPTRRDHDGRNALHYAVFWNCQPPIVRLLVDAGAKVDAEVLSILASHQVALGDDYASEVLPILKRAK